MELLCSDIINHYGDSKQSGSAQIMYTLGGKRYVANYALNDSYEKVAEFLSVPENTTEQSSSAPGADQTFRYIISYHNWSSDTPLETLSLSFAADDPSEAAKEFIGYLEEYDSDMYNVYSQNFSIYVESSVGTSMRIRAKDEEAALSALMRYVREMISAE